MNLKFGQFIKFQGALSSSCVSIFLLTGNCWKNPWKGLLSAINQAGNLCLFDCWDRKGRVKHTFPYHSEVIFQHFSHSILSTSVILYSQIDLYHFISLGKEGPKRPKVEGPFSVWGFNKITKTVPWSIMSIEIGPYRFSTPEGPDGVLDSKLSVKNLVILSYSETVIILSYQLNPSKNLTQN